MGVFLRIFLIVFVSFLFLWIFCRLTEHIPWGCFYLVLRVPFRGLCRIYEDARFVELLTGLPRMALGWSLWIFVIWRCVKHSVEFGVAEAFSLFLILLIFGQSRKLKGQKFPYPWIFSYIVAGNSAACLSLFHELPPPVAPTITQALLFLGYWILGAFDARLALGGFRLAQELNPAYEPWFWEAWEAKGHPIWTLVAGCAGAGLVFIWGILEGFVWMWRRKAGVPHSSEAGITEYTWWIIGLASAFIFAFLAEEIFPETLLEIFLLLLGMGGCIFLSFGIGFLFGAWEARSHPWLREERRPPT